MKPNLNQASLWKSYSLVTQTAFSVKNASSDFGVNFSP